jgi:hypothetical protein
MIVLQPALFFVVYMRDVMEPNDAVFPFVKVKYELMCSNQQQIIVLEGYVMIWNYEPIRSEHKVYGLP